MVRQPSLFYLFQLRRAVAVAKPIGRRICGLYPDSLGFALSKWLVPGRSKRPPCCTALSTRSVRNVNLPVFLVLGLHEFPDVIRELASYVLSNNACIRWTFTSFASESESSRACSCTAASCVTIVSSCAARTRTLFLLLWEIRV